MGESKSSGLEWLDDRSGFFYQSFSHSRDAIMISDARGLVLFINRAFTDLYGFEAEEIVGQHAAAVRHSDTPEEVFSRLWAAILDPGQEFWRGEIRNRRKDGSAVDVILTITPIQEKNSETIAYMGVSVDITERKQMEKKMIEQEKLSSIGLLASGIAHEIGSPLNVISGRAEMVKALLRENHPKATDSMEIIIQQTERISELIKALLNFSRPTGQKTPDTFSEIDMAKVLSETHTLLKKQMEDRGVKFRITQAMPAKMKWDFYKCEQVFVNLLQNAIHAVEDEEDPQIEITIRSPGPGEDGAGGAAQAREIVVEVRDNGSGIPESSVNRVFDPFFTTKAPGMGTGLGLSVVYGLVKEVGGTLRVESRDGEGTTFKLHFPADGRGEVSGKP